MNMFGFLNDLKSSHEILYYGILIGLLIFVAYCISEIIVDFQNFKNTHWFKVIIYLHLIAVCLLIIHPALLFIAPVGYLVVRFLYGYLNK